MADIKDKDIDEKIAEAVFRQVEVDGAFNKQNIRAAIAVARRGNQPEGSGYGTEGMERADLEAIAICVHRFMVNNFFGSRSSPITAHCSDQDALAQVRDVFKKYNLW